MNAHSHEFSIKGMSRVLRVSRSGFYSWRKRHAQPSTRAQKQQQIDRDVKEAFEAAKGRSGSPRLTRDLVDAGKPYNRKTVAKSQRRQGLRAKTACKFKATTNAKHQLPVAPNLLEQDISATEPNTKWVGDISVPQQAAGEMRDSGPSSSACRCW